MNFAVEQAEDRPEIIIAKRIVKPVAKPTAWGRAPGWLCRPPDRMERS